ncbi:hypothetical protein [Dyadobacter sp. BHUBP1]|uniref:hypothetical protein n=1 Tax=Dyadobacter sp. BHUBP1 TaxID=3424178 RepID=UPI003D357DAE
MESKKGYWALLLIFLFLLTLLGCKDGGIFSRKSTVHGQVTEIGGSGLDSIAVIFLASRLSSEKGLLRVYTDKNGNYSGIVDVPRRYGTLSVFVAENGNPKYSDVYRGFDIYINGKRTNDCCPANIGGKTQIDFKVFK